MNQINNFFIQLGKDMYQEKRKEKRVTVFWRIFINGSNLGYLVDISNSGFRFWVKEDHIPSRFIVSFQHPENPDDNKIDFEVNTKWINRLDCNCFCEIGCQLNQLNDNQKKYIQHFIDYFSNKKVHTTQVDFMPIDY